MLKAVYLCLFLAISGMVLASPYLPGDVRLADESSACDTPGVYQVEVADVTSTIRDPFSGETICPMGFEMQFVCVLLAPGQEPPETPRCVRNRRTIQCGVSQGPARRITSP
jgi:hypothetical protein